MFWFLCPICLKLLRNVWLSMCCLLTDTASESVLSLVKEVSTASADSSFDMMSSVIPGYQPPSRKLTTPFSPGCKTPELFTPSSKSLMLLAAAVILHSRLTQFRTEMSSMPCTSCSPAAHRMDAHLENLEKSGNLTLVGEKSGNLRKVGETVVWLWCATAVAIVGKDNVNKWVMGNG